MTPGIAALGCPTGKQKGGGKKMVKKKKSLAFTSHTMPQHERLAKGKRSIEEYISGKTSSIIDQKLQLIIKAIAITEMCRFGEKEKKHGVLCRSSEKWPSFVVEPQFVHNWKTLSRGRKLLLLWRLVIVNSAFAARTT